MATNPISGLIPRGSLGLKLLLVCLLVLVMGVPLLLVGGLVGERQSRAATVMHEIGARSGGAQIVGGPMLLVPYQRTLETTDDEGRTQRRTERGSFVVFAETGAADAVLSVVERRRGIYRAAVYEAVTELDASFRPAAALEGVDPAYRFDWTQARVVMFVSDSRAIRNAAELRFPDGATATFEPISDLSVAAVPVAADYTRPGLSSTPMAPLPGNLQAFAAPARLIGPTDFSVETRLQLTGAQRFSVAAFAQDTSVSIRGDRQDVRAEGYFQAADPVSPDAEGFAVTWRVPFVARGMEAAADLNTFNLGLAAGRDMAVSFVASDDVYQGVARAVRYGIMFIGIVFLATLIFEAVSGRKAHPAQYLLVGLAQCVFYLLLLSITELIGFTPAFLIAAAATVLLLAFYAGASFASRAVGVRALAGLALLYAAMYVLMTLEDFALLAGSIVAFAVIAATMIATRRIDWYGAGAQAGHATQKPAE
ncbi:MAG TPA: cell envelope integrity protein CreD [Vitreimonas sp.]|uniref:cell envelope integrity protein CreD n=1 Tax=Vitreimonas sp. TaxID=3069702 RepID=UPI002D6FE40D|nr:cell envelope integrity protein CreD [Vitreimonas sp.]HYD86309.1 cell envelope integrity protein CreD [Vitreimonas sp.]